MKHSNGTQVLAITDLKFDANLGILEHEIGKSQPLSVDVELNMGTQPLLPDDDEIMSVLDYRRVHDIVIDCCTETHVNLLESLTGKLCLRLMQLPGVIGVRAKVVKLKIFDDCEVAIKQQIGQW
jgi:dihydroneopterin aldolase